MRPARRFVWNAAVAAMILGSRPAGLAAQTAPEPESVVDAFHAALASGDSAAALELLTPEVVIFESGGAEMSREEYRSHHLGADMEFSGSTTREVTLRRVDASGDVALVLSRSSTRGTFREQEIESVGVETMILTRSEDGWQITHIHWSSRRSPSGRTATDPTMRYLTDPAMEGLGLPFSEAVRVDDVLFLSGQIGNMPGTLEPVEGGIVPETRQTMENIRATLERHGSSLERVFKCTVFMADMSEWPAMNEVYATYFPGPKPARTAAGANGLALGARVEIECIALAGDG